MVEVWLHKGGLIVDVQKLLLLDVRADFTPERGTYRNGLIKFAFYAV